MLYYHQILDLVFLVKLRWMSSDQWGLRSISSNEKYKTTLKYIIRGGWSYSLCEQSQYIVAQCNDIN